jgi:redox-sensing transcriptional repressor
MTLPEKTVERLSVYRRTLLICLDAGKTHIYSHELARLHNITAVQVRRDIMFIGYSSTQKKGYNIQELIDTISIKLDSKNAMQVAVIGMGNLGKAVTGYFIGKRPKLRIVASFDIDPKKTGRKISGIDCYPIDKIAAVTKKNNISIALLAVPAEKANEVMKLIETTTIKGVLNFTSVPINTSENIFLEEYDMITSIEKVAYFVKHQK